MEIGYIEPCCAEKQLPPLLRDYPMVAFQTNGDVDFITLLKSVSCLAGNRLEITLMVPEVDVDMLRALEWYGRRGWLAKVTTLTAERQTELIKTELTTVADVTTHHHKGVVDSMVVIAGEAGVVVVQGPLVSRPQPGFRCFTAALGKASSPVVQMCTATLRSLINRRSLDAPEAAQLPRKRKQAAHATAEE